MFTCYSYAECPLSSTATSIFRASTQGFLPEQIGDIGRQIHDETDDSLLALMLLQGKLKFDANMDDAVQAIHAKILLRKDPTLWAQRLMLKMNTVETEDMKAGEARLRIRALPSIADKPHEFDAEAMSRFENLHFLDALKDMGDPEKAMTMKEKMSCTEDIQEWFDGT